MPFLVLRLFAPTFPPSVLLIPTAAASLLVSFLLARCSLVESCSAAMADSCERTYGFVVGNGGCTDVTDVMDERTGNEVTCLGFAEVGEAVDVDCTAVCSVVSTHARDTIEETSVF